MDVLLIPGFWLDGSSWSEVTPALLAAGHTVHALTLPGLESPRADRAGIGFADHVAAVVRLIDDLPGSVALVGHSGGGAIAGAVSDARPERVAHVIYVDAGPLSDGGVVNDELPLDGDSIPLPDWSAFEENELTDLTAPLRDAFRARAVPQPARVSTDVVRLADDRRHDVPSTIVSTSMPSAVLDQLAEAGHPFMAAYARLQNRRVVDLPTGHWPQFTRPVELGAVLVDALDHPPRGR